MSKLPSLTPKKLLKVLKKQGFVEDHQTGSHLVLYDAKSKRRVVVPMHTKDIPKGTLRAILKSAGIDLNRL